MRSASIVDSEPPRSITVGPDTLKLLGKLALSGLAITGGIAGVLLGLSLAAFGLNWLSSTGWIIVVAIGALAACLCVLGLLDAMLGRRPRVEMGPEGFVIRHAFGSRSRRWSDVEGNFVVMKAGLGKIVAYRLTPAFKESAAIKPRNTFAGNDEAISGVFDRPISELAELLNQYKAQHAV